MSYIIKASLSSLSSSTSSSSRKLLQLSNATTRNNGYTRTQIRNKSSNSSNSSNSSRSRKMTPEERNEALRKANEQMKYYHDNRPSMKVLNSKKVKFGDDNRHFIMAGTISTFLCLLGASTFLGKKIARDDEFREKYIPKFYDYSIEKPDYAWTRAELHEQMVQLQVDLHKRAINGDFTPEKLEEMRRHFDANKGGSGDDGGGEDELNGWNKIHPGVDDDEDIEDD